MKVTRRKLIFTGIVGGAALGGLWLASRLPKGEAVRGRALTEKHSNALESLMIALLGSALSADAPQRAVEVARTVSAIAALIDNLPNPTRGEIAQLFELLSIKPARALLGFSGDWRDSDVSQIAQFLYELRDSSIAMKQQAYFALHDLVFGSFYADPASWKESGYAGPPKIA